MNSDNQFVGVLLAGGRGERAKPLTLAGPTYLRSKALIPFLGRPLIEWTVEQIHEQGADDFYVVAHGLENRLQISSLLGAGDRHGVSVRYSRTRLDRYNTGSGAATLHNIEAWDLTGDALVLPVDSVVDLDVAAMRRRHRESGAVVTVAVVERPAAEVAGKYGTMSADADGLVSEFLEKPTREVADRLAREREDQGLGSALPTSAGLYLVDCAALRDVVRRAGLVRRGTGTLDWGGDLLPWLVGVGCPVVTHPIGEMGDLGSVPDFLLSAIGALDGRFPHVTRALGPSLDGASAVWIDPTSLALPDPRTGLTLAEKIVTGMVEIGPGVRIGRHVEIGPGVRLDHADLGDGVDVAEGATVSRAVCADGAIVGPHAVVTDSYLGPLVTVGSSRRRPARLQAFTALGDGAAVPPGIRLSQVTVYPGLRIPREARVPAGSRLASAQEVLDLAG
ncbi:sugar phosphate nucleotidyltransferase [Actinacidiphila acididurans]|uniref:NDP-sugar synthase n=1 Tax=Actinacidiphila acididurans TaxID=2784346 RepID=A0ABS2TYS3_9ACTN|nr:NDP-sugar synthase [Actinacidiphila acididurans]MBM9507455.1 NDP-sugar synthase [Actinacidiphila acididurans]